MAERLDKIVQETAAKLNYPPEVVMSVITFVFQYTHNFLKAPTAAVLRLPYLGSFTLSMYKLRYILDKTKLNNHSHFKKLWPLRHIVYDYHKYQNLTFYGHKKKKSI
jgi:hypothetical protein